VVLTWAATAMPGDRAMVAFITAEAVVAYALGWLPIASRARGAPAAEATIAAAAVLFLAEFTLVAASTASGAPPLAALAATHVANLGLILALAWKRRWPFVAPAAVLPAWIATLAGQARRAEAATWKDTLALATTLYAVFMAYPFILDRRARDSREPHLTAIAGSVFFFFAARAALVQGGLSSVVGIVPVAEGLMLALLLRELLAIQPPGRRDLGRLALVAGSALAFATVAIPLQLKHQWITI